MAYYVIREANGKLIQEDISWLHEIAQNYDGAHNNEHIDDLFAKLKNVTEDQFQAFINYQTQSSDRTLTLRKMTTTFLDSGVNSFTWLSDKTVNKLLVIKSQIDILNEIVEEYRFYFAKSYEKISDANHEKIVQGCRASGLAYAKTAKTIINLISELKLG